MALFSDEQLASGIQRGRADDLTLLVERHHVPLLGFLYRMTGGDLALAEDLAQETFLRVLSRIDTYRAPRPFKPWLYAIAINLTRDHYKQAELRHTDSVTVHLEIPVAITPETEIAGSEEMDQIGSAISDLPIQQREAILLRYFQDLSLAEISLVQQVPVGTVKSRLSLGLKRMKGMLKGWR